MWPAPLVRSRRDDSEGLPGAKVALQRCSRDIQTDMPNVTRALASHARFVPDDDRLDRR